VKPEECTAIMNTQRIKNFFIRYGHIFWLVFCAFLVITICSKCSFLYPFNDWDDSNCFFTVGKAMAQGKVLYRDIYEQKGIYLYVMHSLAYLISEDTFIGIYLFELVFAAIYSYCIYRLLELYIGKLKAIIFTPVILLLTYASACFCRGDSAEEFLMPLMAASLLFLLQYTKGGKLSYLKYAFSGVFAALALWVKFTLCGFFMGWIIFAFAAEVRAKNIKKAFIGVGVFLGAMIVASLPSFIYFAANGAMSELFECYFYNNLFLYGKGAGENFFVKIGKAFWAYGTSFWYGLAFNLALIPGFVYLTFTKKYSRLEKAAIFSTYAAFVFFTFIGGRRSRYYGLPLAIYSFTGIVALCEFKFTQKALDKLLGKFMLVACAALVLSGGLCMAISTNVPFMFTDKNDMAQYRFAKIISSVSAATILNYGMLDKGFYTVAKITPRNKYFCRLNIPLDEMLEKQEQSVNEGWTDFVVCGAVLPENIDKYYVLVDSVTQKDADETVTYTLYARKITEE